MNDRSKPGKRHLSEDEHRLWRRVTVTAKPLHGPQSKIDDDDDRPPPATENLTLPASAMDSGTTALPEFSRLIRKPEPGKPAGPLPLTGLDRRTQQRLRRGRIEVDGTLDLHGMTQNHAHSALRSFVISAQRRGDKMVLIITGKGSQSGLRFEAEKIWGSGRGILRRLVPEWLSQHDLRPYVSGFRDAHQRHGGGGALYVRIRRPR